MQNSYLYEYILILLLTNTWTRQWSSGFGKIESIGYKNRQLEFIFLMKYIKR